MAKGRNSTGFGLRMQDGLLAEIEVLARSRGLTRNELIVELVKLGLDNWGKDGPSPLAVQPGKRIGVGIAVYEPVAKTVQSLPIAKAVNIKKIRRE